MAEFLIGRQVMNTVAFDAIPTRKRLQRRFHRHNDSDGMVLVLGGEDADVCHKRAGAVGGLQLFQSDIFPVQRLDHVFLAIDDFQHPASLFVSIGELADVAGLEPAVGGEGLFVFIVEVKVAFRDSSSTDPDLALWIRGVGGVVREIGDVDEFDLDAARGFAYGGRGPGGGVADGTHSCAKISRRLYWTSYGGKEK